MLQPRVWICQSWTIRHPGEDVLRRIMSPWVYPGERDLFITSLHKINESYIGESRAKDFTSKRGHLVVRVYQGGEIGRASCRERVHIAEEANTVTKHIKEYERKRYK